MRYILLIIFLLTVNCSSNKTTNNHGSLNLIQKHNEFIINKNNKNDIMQILGTPPVKSKFNENQWIYIEREKTNQSLLKLGIKKIKTNNVLVVEFNNKGMLIKKNIYDITSMKEIDFTKNTTNRNYQEKSLIYETLTSLRERMDAPAKNRRK